jgi:CDP-diacylglycerol--glycerol-3-phosphate 3-phosphatidyltransferase
MIDGRRGRKDADADLDEENLLDEENPESGDSVEAELLEIELEPGTPQTAEAATPSPAAAGTEGEAAEDESGNAFVRLLKSLGPALVRIGVTADHVTIFGLVVAAATGALIATGHFVIAIFVGTFGCLMDTLDGAVAKAAGTSSKRGAFFDSVTDRVADMFVFGGLAWYFAAGSGHDPKMAVLPLVILGVANTISYERAKAESLGYDAKGGLMERAERLIIVGLALIYRPATVPILFVLLALCVITAWQRFHKVWVQATAEMAGDGAAAVGESPALRTRRPPRVESRWRAWREARATPERHRQRQRLALASRSRSRRRAEPIGTRVRRAFASDGPRSDARVRSGSASGRLGRPRSERRQQGAAAAFRRRLGSGR